MTQWESSPHVPFDVPVGVDSAARAVMEGITAQDYIDNPELKVYVEDALRLVLAARPERPLDLIDAYLQSVMMQENVIGREFAYVNATMRNRRAFVRTVHEVFVGGTPQDNSRKSYGSGETGIPTPTSTGLSSGFLQQDVVHVLNLVCPDFPVEIVGRVVKILAEGRHDADLAQPLDDCRERFLQKQHQTCQGTTAVERMPFEMFLQAFSIYFCFQDFFRDMCAIFGPLAAKNEGDTGIRDGGSSPPARVSLRILLDQLQLMKAEPRNQLRYMDMRSAEVAAKKGGIGEYVALSELLACLLLHSDRVAFSLLERPPVDGYADRLEACPALWSDDASCPPSLGGCGDATAESLGRRKKGTRKALIGKAATAT